MKATTLLPLAAILAPALAAGQPAPAADHHQHLFSPTAAALLAPPNTAPHTITARVIARNVAPYLR
jgi:hypothetical protein